MAAEDSSSSALTAGRDGQLQRHFVAKWRQNGYTRLPSGHNFCREVRRVSQVTRNDKHTRTAFHANLIAMDNGLLDIEDVAADDHVLCTQCARGESAVPTPCSSATCPTNTSGLHKHFPDETPVADQVRAGTRT